MAEPADASVSKTDEGNLVGVRLPLSAPTRSELKSRLIRPRRGRSQCFPAPDMTGKPSGNPDALAHLNGGGATDGTEGKGRRRHLPAWRWALGSSTQIGRGEAEEAAEVTLLRCGSRPVRAPADRAFSCIGRRSAAA